MRIDSQIARTLVHQSDRVRVCSWGDNEVVFQVLLVAVEKQVHAGIDALVFHLRVGRDVGVPLFRVVADEVVHFCGQRSTPATVAFGFAPSSCMRRTESFYRTAAFACAPCRISREQAANRRRVRAGARSERLLLRSETACNRRRVKGTERRGPSVLDWPRTPAETGRTRASSRSFAGTAFVAASASRLTDETAGAARCSPMVDHANINKVEMANATRRKLQTCPAGISSAWRFSSCSVFPKLIFRELKGSMVVSESRHEYAKLTFEGGLSHWLRHQRRIVGDGHAI